MAKRRFPKLPITASKATMRLITAIITGDEDLANWVLWAYRTKQITGTEGELRRLRERLSEALGPQENDKGHETRNDPVALTK